MVHNMITPDLVQQKIDELIALKQQLESGKATIANAITSKGVSTSQDAEFNLLAENILAIEQGVDPNSITVSAEITQGSWSSNKMTVTAKAKGSNGKTATASTTVDATSIYNAGKSVGSSSGGGTYTAVENSSNQTSWSVPVGAICFFCVYSQAGYAPGFTGGTILTEKMSLGNGTGGTVNVVKATSSTITCSKAMRLVGYVK